IDQYEEMNRLRGTLASLSESISVLYEEMKQTSSATSSGRAERARIHQEIQRLKEARDDVGSGIDYCRREIADLKMEIEQAKTINRVSNRGGYWG
ncbi:MAG: hypothetical protein ACYDAR_20895, partial [Thermomicrobiales bacterium]